MRRKLERAGVILLVIIVATFVIRSFRVDREILFELFGDDIRIEIVAEKTQFMGLWSLNVRVFDEADTMIQMFGVIRDRDGKSDLPTVVDSSYNLDTQILRLVVDFGRNYEMQFPITPAQSTFDRYIKNGRARPVD